CLRMPDEPGIFSSLAIFARSVMFLSFSSARLTLIESFLLIPDFKRYWDFDGPRAGAFLKPAYCVQTTKREYCRPGCCRHGRPSPGTAHLTEHGLSCPTHRHPKTRRRRAEPTNCGAEGF